LNPGPTILRVTEERQELENESQNPTPSNPLAKQKGKIIDSKKKKAKHVSREEHQKKTLTEGSSQNGGKKESELGGYKEDSNGFFSELEKGTIPTRGGGHLRKKEKKKTLGKLRTRWACFGKRTMS